MANISDGVRRMSVAEKRSRTDESEEEEFDTEEEDRLEEKLERKRRCVKEMREKLKELEELEIEEGVIKEKIRKKISELEVSWEGYRIII